MASAQPFFQWSYVSSQWGQIRSDLVQHIALRRSTASISPVSSEAGPLSVAALKNGEVQVVELFSSDGNVVSNNFVALTDNKHLEGADYIVPVIRKSVNQPALQAALAKVNEKLTTNVISKLNLEVTAQKEQPAAVAKAWLKSQGLI